MRVRLGLVLGLWLFVCLAGLPACSSGGGAAGGEDVVVGADLAPGGEDAPPGGDAPAGPDVYVPPPGDDFRGITSFWADEDPCGPLQPDCRDHADCAAGQRCINTQCVDPVAPGAYEFSDSLGIMWDLQFPSEMGLTDCCFDIDGDGVPDNAAADLFALILGDPDIVQPDEDATEAMRKTLRDDFNLYLFELRHMPAHGCGPASVAVWPVTNDLDRSGEPDQSLEQWSSGQGVFQVLPKGFSDYGGIGQFNRAAVDSGVLRGEWGQLDLRYADDALFLDLRMSDLRWELPFTEEEGGLRSVDGEGGVGGVKLTGRLPLTSFVAGLDRVLRTCECAGFDPSAPVMSHRIESGQFHIDCVQTASGAAACENMPVGGGLCAAAPMICMFAALLPMHADVSTGALGSDGTSALDALSFSLLGRVAPARLAEQPVAPSLAAVDDRWAMTSDVRPARLDVLNNDIGGENPAARITEVNEPRLAMVEIVEDGRALRFTPDEGLDWHEFAFTYTVSLGEQSSTGLVRIVLHGFDGDGPVITANADSFQVELNRGPAVLDVLANDVVDEQMAPFIYINGPANINDSVGGTYGWLTPDRRKVVIFPAPNDFTERSFTFNYMLADRPHMGYSAVDSTVNLVRPTPRCGDGIVDPWAEQCDDGNEEDGDSCSSDCQVVACPGGGDPQRWYTDEDGDGYGDSERFVFACEAPADTVLQGGDCDDDNAEVHPNGTRDSPHAGTCGDGLDNDCMFGTDCGSLACTDQYPCVERSRDIPDVCHNGLDDDGDGRTDCDDPDCQGEVGCAETICDDGLDDDGDGRTDCDDHDCARDPACTENVCDDGLDNDLDGVTDCDDPDCNWQEPCMERLCGDGIDGDRDGMTDCDDPDCEWAWECRE